MQVLIAHQNAGGGGIAQALVVEKNVTQALRAFYAVNPKRVVTTTGRVGEDRS